MMATLHFIGGKAGAGKTTLARELGKSERAVVISKMNGSPSSGLLSAHLTITAMRRADSGRR